MIFKTPEELVEFFNKLDLENSTLVFKGDEEAVVEESAKDCACGGTGTCQCPTTESADPVVVISKEPESILIESFSETPAYTVRINESDEDIFYVSDFESIPDACGTGMVELPNYKAHMNMCEMEGVATVNLDVIVEGQKLNLNMRLAKTEGEPYVLLSKKHFSS